MTKYEIHPLAQIFPQMPDEQFDALKTSIKSIGQQEPITLLDGKILDGQHRYRACVELGIEVLTEDFDGENPVSFVLARNFCRRHLSQSQLAYIGAEMSEQSKQGRKKEKVSHDTFLTIDEVSAIISVSPASIKRARKIVQSKNDDLKNLVKSGQINVFDGLSVLEKPKEIQNKLIEVRLSGDKRAFKTIMLENSEARTCLACSKESEHWRSVCEKCFNEVDKRGKK